MARGLGLNIDTLIAGSPNQKDSGFRIISTYVPEIDEFVCKLDIKIGGNQYSSAMCVGEPVKPDSGSKISGQHDLMTPSSGVVSCQNFKVANGELIRALTEIVEDLKSDK
jgi:hypothetical protein